MTNKFDFSVLPETLRGVCLFYTGQAGSGKTIGSLLDPFNTVYIDADHFKGKTACESNPAIKYHGVNSDDKNDPSKTGERFLAAIDTINYDETTVVVIDNLYEAQEGLHAYAIKNPIEVAKRTNKIAANITGRKWGQDHLAHERLLKGVVDELLANQVTVIIIAHMKNKFGVIGQLEIRGRDWVFEAASFVGIFIRTGSAPDVLVFKSAFHHNVAVDPRKLSKKDLEKYRSGELSTSVIYPQLPRRIPDMTPTKLFKYLARSPEEIAATPYGQDELFDEDEMAPYVEILTKDQRANVNKMLEMDDAERQRAIELEANLRESQRAEMNEFIISNPDELSLQQLITKVKKDFPNFAAEINPPYIMSLQG